jgi:single-strand DNA-binding protein
MVNNVVLVGRLTRDPEFRTTTTGKSVCSFCVAVQKNFKPQDGSPDCDFLNIVAWNKDADYVINYLAKGRLVSIEGRLQSRKYTASDGTTREVVEVVANAVQGLDRPREEPPAQTGEVIQLPQADEYDPFADE